MRDSICNFLKELPPVHKEGWVFVLIFLLAALLLWQIWAFLGVLGFTATLWCAWFFRDPARVVSTRKDSIVSAADGKVTAITRIVPPEEMGLGSESRIKISVFLTIFDVHINRAPCDGKVVGKYYVPGKFLNAELDKSSVQNERLTWILQRPDGAKVVMVQIAGMLAKRIVSWKKDGDTLAKGERIGLIRFGSRVDVYLPQEADVRVMLGQKVFAGETVLADLPLKN